MAVMMVSGSMPFCFASASIVCCSGLFICLNAGTKVPAYVRRAGLETRLELNVELAARDQRQRQAMPAALRAFEQHGVALDALEPPGERLLVVNRLGHDDFHHPAREPPIVVDASQRPIEPRRRNLERIRKGKRV